MNVVTNDHYRDIGSYLSRSPKITMTSVNCPKRQVAFVILNTDFVC